MLQNIYHLLPQVETLNQQKWANHYWKLCNRAVNRELPKEAYIERHHTIPKCVGGPQDHSLSVKLTAREHFVAHLLLVKMYPNNPRLIYAAFIMSRSKKNNRHINNREYEWLKKKRKENSNTPEMIEKSLKTRRDNGNWYNHVAFEVNIKRKNTQLINRKYKSVAAIEKSIEKSLETRRKNGTINTQTPNVVANIANTKRKNGTMNNSPDVIHKQLETKRKNGTMSPSTPESVAKCKETWRQKSEFKNYIYFCLVYINQYI